MLVKTLVTLQVIGPPHGKRLKEMWNRRREVGFYEKVAGSSGPVYPGAYESLMRTVFYNCQGYYKLLTGYT
jgi:hypothetical protein